MARFIRGSVSISILLLTFVPIDAGARPEKIRPGVSYYSDEVVELDGVKDLGDEKNYEEVYQFYRYFEAIYDDTGRVTVFIEYVRGEVRQRDEYSYGSDGKLRERKPPGDG